MPELVDMGGVSCLPAANGIIIIIILRGIDEVK
jgi:hypothetical protein